MTKFLNKFNKNPIFGSFWSIFTILGAKKRFTEIPALSCTTSHGFLGPCQNLEKTKDTIPRKFPNRRTEGQAQSVSKDSSSYCWCSK